MNKKWNEKTTFEKVMDIIAGVALCVWLVFEYLGKKIGFEYSETASCIAMLVVCVCEAVSYWKVKRAFSYVAIGGAVCILTAMILLALL